MMTKLCDNYLIVQSTVKFPVVLNFNIHSLPKDDVICCQVMCILLYKCTATATGKQVFEVVTRAIVGTDPYNCSY